ncbi:MAG: SpoIVB peptidase, partial [Clostridia bacterium]|nr:SpoIVB peptidase [Clostridia bacterium]
CDVTVNGVVKGSVGTPGEIKGYFKSGKTGAMIKNSECGVYGVFTHCPTDIEPMPIALRGEVREGEAYILCTLDQTSGIQKYSVSISNINRGAQSGKCFTVKITDPRLIEKTGGIVQGMSGSPIIQNGKLVGAVTHVMINDPTTGYGIFIENMLNAAQMPQARAS